MKATDLMIGDYVFWNWVTHKVDFDGDVMTDRGYEVSRRIIKVSSINETGITFKSLKDGSQIYIKEEDLAPIPLTEEILEKNGYKYRDWWYEQEGYPDITNMFTDDMYAVGKHHYYGNGQPEFNSIIKIQYVHELQHALKLCKIEKEIIL